MVSGGGFDNKRAAAVAAALAQELPGFSIFFDQTGLAAAAADGEGGGAAAAGDEDLEELEWLSNKDAFPSVETMAVEAEEDGAVPEPVPALSAPSWRPAVGPRTKGRRRRESAPWNVLTAPVIPAPKRCLHCSSEVTPQWRQGPLGPRTLCNACGVRYNTGRLLPEYRPANSPTFSPRLHSNSHRRVLRMRLQSGSEGEGEGEGEGPSPADRANAKARRAVRAAARLAAKIKKDGAPAPAPAPAQTPAPLQ